MMILNANEYKTHITNNSNKLIYAAFYKILGFSKHNSIYIKNIYKILGLNLLTNNKKIQNLSNSENNILIFYFTIFLQHKLGTLIKTKSKYFLNLKHVQNSYRYIRIRLNLPINGQRTHTNAKTSKKNL